MRCKSPIIHRLLGAQPEVVGMPKLSAELAVGQLPGDRDSKPPSHSRLRRKRMVRRSLRLLSNWLLGPVQHDRMHRDLVLVGLALHSNALGPWASLAMSTNAGPSVIILFSKSQLNVPSALKGMGRGNLSVPAMRKLSSSAPQVSNVPGIMMVF